MVQGCGLHRPTSYALSRPVGKHSLQGSLKRVLEGVLLTAHQATEADEIVLERDLVFGLEIASAHVPPPCLGRVLHAHSRSPPQRLRVCQNVSNSHPSAFEPVSPAPTAERTRAGAPGRGLPVVWGDTGALAGERLGGTGGGTRSVEQAVCISFFYSSHRTRRRGHLAITSNWILPRLVVTLPGKAP